jgi:hypothetical protein
MIGDGGGIGGGVDRVEISATPFGGTMNLPSSAMTYMGPFTGGIGAYASPFGMGDFIPSIPTPVMPKFKEEKTFGQKAGESIKNFLKRLARIHPATRNVMFVRDFIKGLQNSENPQDFVKGMLSNLAMQKVGSNLGVSPMARAGIGTLRNVSQGRMTPGQGLASLGTSAAFRQGAPSLFKSAYDKGGMNAVYGVASLLGMAQRAAQQKIMQPGPGGDG